MTNQAHLFLLAFVWLAQAENDAGLSLAIRPVSAPMSIPAVRQPCFDATRPAAEPPWRHSRATAPSSVSTSPCLGESGRFSAADSCADSGSPEIDGAQRPFRVALHPRTCARLVSDVPPPFRLCRGHTSSSSGARVCGRLVHTICGTGTNSASTSFLSRSIPSPLHLFLYSQLLQSPANSSPASCPEKTFRRPWPSGVQPCLPRRIVATPRVGSEVLFPC